MRLLIFHPDDDAVREAVDGALAKYRKTTRIEWSTVTRLGTSDQDKHSALGEALEDVSRRHGFVIVNPPRDLKELERIDQVCRGAFGRRGSPQAVFFAPRGGGKALEEHLTYREEFREIYHHYDKDRRAYTFRKARRQSVRKALKQATATMSLVRWGIAMPIVVLAAALLLVGTVFRDPLLKMLLISQCRTAFGARTEIGELSTTLPAAVTIRRMAVADRRRPMQNLFEFDELTGDISIEALLSRRVRVRELTLAGLRFNSPRTTSGALPGAAPVKKDAAEGGDAAGWGFGAADFQKQFDELFEGLLARLEPPKLEDLKTVQLASRLEEEGPARLEKIKGMVDVSRVDAYEEEARKTLAELENAGLPESVEKVTAGVKELKDAGLGGEELDAVRADIESAAKIAFDAEQKKIEQAKADVVSIDEHVKKANAALERAKAVKMVEGLADVPRVKKLLDDLETVRKELKTSRKKLASARGAVDDVRKSIASKKKKGDGTLAGAGSRLEQIKKTIEDEGDGLVKKYAAMKEDVEKAREDLKGEEKRLKGTFEDLKSRAKALRAELEGIRAEVTAGVAFLEAQRDGLTEALKADRDGVRERYGIAGLDADGLAEALLGDQVGGWVVWGYAAYEKARPYVISAQEKAAAAKPTRLKGTTYAFPPEKGEPTMWIEKALFSGQFPMGADTFSLEGEALDLSSDPALTGRDMTAEMRAESGGRSFGGSFVVKPDGECTLSLEADGIDMGGHTFEGRYAPSEITAGKLGVQAEAGLVGDSAGIDAELALTELALTPPPAEGMDARLAGVLRNVYARIRALEATVEAEFEGARLVSFKCGTDAGPVLAEALKESLGEELEKAREEALAFLEEQIREPREKALAQIEKTVGGLNGQLPGPLEGLDSIGGLIDQKEGGTLEKLAGAEAGIDIGGDPASVVVGSTNEATALEAMLGRQKTRLGEDAKAQSDALGELGTTLGAREGTLGSLDKNVDGQSGRLQELIKKALQGDEKIKLPKIKLPEIKF